MVPTVLVSLRETSTWVLELYFKLWQPDGASVFYNFLSFVLENIEFGLFFPKNITSCLSADIIVEAKDPTVQNKLICNNGKIS